MITRTIAIHIYHSKCAYKSIMLQTSKISGFSILANISKISVQTFQPLQTNISDISDKSNKTDISFQTSPTFEIFQTLQTFQTDFHTFQALQTSQPGLSKPPQKKMAGTKTKSLQNFFTINPQSHTSLVVPIYYSNAPRNVAYLHRDQCHYWLRTPIPPWLNGPRSMVTNAARHPWNWP